MANKAHRDILPRPTNAVNEEFRNVESKIKQLLTRGDVQNKMRRNNYEGTPQIYIGDFQIYNSYKSHPAPMENQSSVIKQVNNFINENYDQVPSRESFGTNQGGRAARRLGYDLNYTNISPSKSGLHSAYGSKFVSSKNNRNSSKSRPSIDHAFRRLEEEHE